MQLGRLQIKPLCTVGTTGTSIHSCLRAKFDDFGKSVVLVFAFFTAILWGWWRSQVVRYVSSFAILRSFVRRRMLLNRFSILLSNLKSEIKSTLLNTFTSESMTTIRQIWLICLRKTLWRGVAHFDHIKLTVKIHIKNRQPSIHHQYYVKSYNCTRWCIICSSLSICFFLCKN